MKVLVIDDNKDITEMLVKFLKVKGIDCVAINDARIGLDTIKKQKFDTILLDMSMPDFSGQDVIDELEKEDMLKNLRIIIFTASSISNEHIDMLLKTDGIELCLRKPVKLDDLLIPLKQ